MLLLRHLLPGLLMPTMLTLLCVIIAIFTKRKRFLWAGLAILWLSSTPLMSSWLMRATEGWAIREPASAASSADAIVVLSGMRQLAPGPAAITEWGDADRFEAGIELMKAGKAPLLIFTGAWSPLHPTPELEGETLVRLAGDRGLSPERLTTTGQVGTTAEEATAVARLLGVRAIGAKGQARVLLVTSAFHMRRARKLFERAGMVPIPFPVDFQVPAGGKLGVLDFFPTGLALRQTEIALRELYGWIYYLVIG